MAAAGGEPEAGEEKRKITGFGSSTVNKKPTLPGKKATSARPVHRGRANGYSNSDSSAALQVGKASMHLKYVTSCHCVHDHMLAVPALSLCVHMECRDSCQPLLFLFLRVGFIIQTK